MNNQVSGATAGSLRLTQEAYGGDGGSSVDATVGSGGSALSRLTATNLGGGALTGFSIAIAGAGGNAMTAAATRNVGGPATANIKLTATNSPVSASAGAFAGLGSNGTAALQGSASAEASSTTSGGNRAFASADAIGLNAAALSQSETSLGAISDMKLLAGTPSSSCPLFCGTPKPSSEVVSQTVGTFGGTFDNSTVGMNARLQSTALPQSTSVTNALLGNSNVSASLIQPGQMSTAIALVAVGLQAENSSPTSSYEYMAQAQYSLDPNGLPHHNIKIGLLDPSSHGEFTQLQFSIQREGVTIESQTFTSAASLAYFNDHVIDLGSMTAGVTGMLDLSFSFELISPLNGATFGETFLIADVGAPSGLQGDYNDDGIVDAADYTVSRDALGSTTNLAADGNGNGIVDAADYDVWKTNFGAHAGSGAGAEANAAVPEPSTMVLMLFAAAGWCRLQREAA